MTRTASRILLLLVVASALAACAGTHPAPRYAWDPKADFAPLKTYAWYQGPGFQMPHGDSIIDGQFIDERVRKAVDEGLAAKGFQKVDAANASMFVSYGTGDTSVSDEVKDPNYAWLTGYESTMYEKSRAMTIDIRDRQKKLLWVGSITRLEGENPDAVGREIDHEIHVLLDHFPPAPGATPSK
jgi:Domain of unknown function (DUF4136)